jgi:hypothetical protein
MGIETNSVITATEQEERRLLDYSHKFPGFRGEFDWTVAFIGGSVTRKERVVYSHTPEWEYFDLHKNAPYAGWNSSSYRIETQIRRGRSAVPKSRTRKKRPKKPPPGVEPMTPRVYEALPKQRKAFIDKFGREPGPDDPVCFDPDKDVPTPIVSDLMNADLEKALRDSGIDHEKAEAFRKVLR